jgi:hypothetical protein
LLAARGISTTSQVLGRTLGERVEVQTVLGAGVWNAEVDPNQLEHCSISP